MESMKAALESLESTEAVLSEEAEINLAETTDALYDISTRVTTKTKELTRDILVTQRQLRNETIKVSSQAEKLIDSMTSLSREMKSIEMESHALPNLEAWISNITEDIAHMKAQVMFLHQIMQEEKVGKKVAPMTVQITHEKCEIGKETKRNVVEETPSTPSLEPPDEGS